MVFGGGPGGVGSGISPGGGGSGGGSKEPLPEPVNLSSILQWKPFKEKVTALGVKPSYPFKNPGLRI